MATELPLLPSIDVAALEAGGEAQQRAIAALTRACEQAGFFHAVNHGVDPTLLRRLEQASREFFALPSARKPQKAR